MNGFRWFLVGALAAGVLLRLPQLGLRPMHTDEAVHAVKFGALLETGTYRYDRNEYHGPTLNYLTLVPAWLSSRKVLSEVTESTLRSVPVFFGIGLLLLPLLLSNIGRIPVAAIIALTALSPAMAFYSRYYIQEILLVFFTFGLIIAAYRLFLSGRVGWAITAGIFAGLMCATKETWILAVSCMIVSGALVWILQGERKLYGSPVRLRHILVALIAGAAVAVMFFSSFFTHWQGVVDAVRAYEMYVDRAAGDGSHIHPWHYYLQMLTFWRAGSGPVWSEAAILALAILGIVNSVSKDPSQAEATLAFKRFIACYALLMITVHSVIPYKTPWVMLGAFHGIIILAGFGTAQLVKWCDAFRLRVVGIALISVVVAHLGWQACNANFRYYESPENPYVYAHTTNDVTLIAERVIEVARSSPQGFSTPVQVVIPDGQYWPLPWYFRMLPNVGWWSEPVGEFTPTPIILASPEFEPVLLQRLYETPVPGERVLYVPLFERPLQLRPGKEVAGYVTADLWNLMQQNRTPTTP